MRRPGTLAIQRQLHFLASFFMNVFHSFFLSFYIYTSEEGRADVSGTLSLVGALSCGPSARRQGGQWWPICTPGRPGRVLARSQPEPLRRGTPAAPHHYKGPAAERESFSPLLFLSQQPLGSDPLARFSALIHSGNKRSMMLRRRRAGATDV